jgi:hypothetical protein
MEAIEKAKIREDMLSRKVLELRRIGVECGLEGNAVLGKRHGEPFCIYVRWMHETRRKFVGLMVLRWKGEDRVGVDPVEVLR